MALSFFFFPGDCNVVMVDLQGSVGYLGVTCLGVEEPLFIRHASLVF